MSWIILSIFAPLTASASAVTPPYFSIRSFSRDPEFTPTLIGIFLDLAASTTAFTLSRLPMLPGLILILSAPFSMAAIASL